MPNWCTNAITLQHSDPQRITELAALVNYDRSNDSFDPDVENRLLNYLRPLPDGVWDYDWCVRNWGTKWEVNVYHVELLSPHCIAFYCETAWTPPIAALAYAESQKGFDIKAAFIEPGSGILGFYEGGSEQYYDYPQSYNEAMDLLDQLPEFVLDGLDLSNEFTLEFSENVY
jgi:hypothetical protein